LKAGQGFKRLTVEYCLALDVKQIAAGVTFRSWDLEWTAWACSPFSSNTLLVRYRVVRLGSGETGLRLRYTISGVEIVEHVPLTTSRHYHGVTITWGLCPIAKGGERCGYRCGTLYLPPGQRLFGCRRCHSLTYLSCQNQRWGRWASRVCREATGERG
jgi:hypothetical protein